jgi:PST family polysaccharide transporter
LTGERQRVARGAVWSAVDFWTQQTSSLLTLIVVGNMIGPTAVGILAMAQFAVSLAMAFVLDGLSDAVVQRQEIRPAHFDTAFWLLLGIGSLAGITLAALSPAIALLFGEPELTLVLPLLAIGLPFAGITAAYQAIVQRELKFSLLAIRSLISATTGFLVAIGMARLGFGVLSLVGFFVVSRILDAVVLASTEWAISSSGFSWCRSTAFQSRFFWVHWRPDYTPSRSELRRRSTMAWRA